MTKTEVNANQPSLARLGWDCVEQFSESTIQT